MATANVNGIRSVNSLSLQCPRSSTEPLSTLGPLSQSRARIWNRRSGTRRTGGLDQDWADYMLMGKLLESGLCKLELRSWLSTAQGHDSSGTGLGQRHVLNMGLVMMLVDRNLLPRLLRQGMHLLTTTSHRHTVVLTSSTHTTRSSSAASHSQSLACSDYCSATRRFGKQRARKAE
jgi:hypothetical protein